MKKDVWIGIDVGSVSIKAAVLIKAGDAPVPAKNLVESEQFFVPEKEQSLLPDGVLLLLSNYYRHQGEPLEAVSDLMDRITVSVPAKRMADIRATGSGGRRCAEQFGFGYINEFRALAEGMRKLYPEVRTVFELGGEKSKYMLLSPQDQGQVQIIDYETNGECAAGTGSFFDQQVGRLKYKIEEVGELIRCTERTASIAGRCSVFAKSDMIHAQQRGFAPPEVLKGLCEAVVRNYKGSITKGKTIHSKAALIGGVAANRGVVDSFRKLFDFSDGELLIPDLYAWMGAVGSGLIGMKENNPSVMATEWGTAPKIQAEYPTIAPLSLKKVRLLRDRVSSYQLDKTKNTDAFLGVDVGSVSTNLALIDSGGDLIHGIYLMTDGRPIEIVREAFTEMASVVGNHVRIVGAGTTGSGRELIGTLIGADVIKDEITAHKTGAIHVCRKYMDREVDTIFEIGGQDSKFISIKDGVVVDFSLNEACAAGTGSFLEEQAKEIGIRIRNEFAELALRSRHPLKLGERCTVFMEKELVPYLHQGVPKEDIVAGLAVSVVQNYLNRVVKKRHIGDVIFFQGGTAYNDSVAAAFSTVLQKEIIVPPHNGIMGAIGAALLARQHQNGKLPSSFRGWNLDELSWKRREFVCKGCSNECQIQEFDVEGEKSYWGDKCSEKYRKRTKTSRSACIEDLTKYRDSLLFADTPGKAVLKTPDRGRVGIPRALNFFDRIPFWKTYFEQLGFETVLSSPSRQKLIHAGVEATVAEPCFPIQVVHGHLLDLKDRDLRLIFLPNLVNEEDPDHSIASFVCPWAQTMPLVTLHTPDLEAIYKLVFYPNLQFREGRKFIQKQLDEAVSRFGIGARENHAALSQAFQAQDNFVHVRLEAGQKALKEIEKNGAPFVILLGRPYNLADTGLNLNIPSKLRETYGINVIPLDFLPLEGVDIRDVHDHMFWNYGRKILQAARWSRDRRNAHLIYLSNFKCGPDSYIRHYVEKISGKPFLFLQLDSHANDAGVMTRIEAFLESKGIL
jgi:predicted CoA-substrate-specific enzyme activase